MYFRKQITALGGGVRVHEIRAWAEAAGGCGLPAGLRGRGRAAGGAGEGEGEGERGGGGHFPLSQGDGTGPLMLPGPSLGFLNWGLSRSQPSSRALLAPSPVLAEVSLLAVSAWKQ